MTENGETAGGPAGTGEDPRTTAELVRAALEDSDGEAGWACVVALHHRGTPDVLEAARELSRRDDPQARTLAADILGQLGGSTHHHGDPTAADEFRRLRLDILFAMVETEDDPRALRSIGIAFGHVGDPAALPVLTRLAAHPHAMVRFGAAWGLVACDTPAAVDALLTCMDDPDPDIRNWATYGIGTRLDVDAPEIRAALHRRLDDPSDEVRGEALMGLAQRRDSGTAQALLRELDRDTLHVLAIEAAATLGDTRLRDPLKKWLDTGSIHFREAVEDAIALCTPDEAGSP